MIRDLDRITHLLTAIADAKESIAGLRNIVAHEYMNVDYNEVWQAVTKDFDELKRQVEPLLDELKAAGSGSGEVRKCENGEA